MPKQKNLVETHTDAQPCSKSSTKHKHKPGPCPPEHFPPRPHNCICTCLCQTLDITGIAQIIEAKFCVIEVKHVQMDCMKCVKLIYKVTVEYINCAGQTKVFCEHFTRLFCDFANHCGKKPPIAIFCNPPAIDINCDNTFVLKTIAKVCC